VLLPRPPLRPPPLCRAMQMIQSGKLFFSSSSCLALHEIDPTRRHGSSAVRPAGRLDVRSSGGLVDQDDSAPRDHSKDQQQLLNIISHQHDAELGS
jgi:hypothetical protein